MNETIEPLPVELTRLRNRALIAGAIALSVCALVALLIRSTRQQFFTSYLFAYLFCLGLALGSLAIVMLHHLVGGHWGQAIRGPAEVATMTLPLLAILFIPIALGAHHLYDWADPNKVAADAVLRHRDAYMHRVYMRIILCFIIWTIFALLLRMNLTARTKRLLSAWGLIIYIVTMSIAAIDWILSREVHFYSTIIGLLTTVSQTLTAMAFLIALLAMLWRVSAVKHVLSPSMLNDLGNLLLTLVILWAYMSFAQFLIVWMGNTTQDTTFYARRGLGQVPNGWRFIGFVLIVFHFFIPFLLLLSRDAKRHLKTLTTIATFVLILRVVDVYWMAVPSSTRDVGLHVSWMDLLMPIGVFGIWFAAFVGLLNRKRLVVPLEEEIIGDARVEHG